jgi:phosphoribosylanthranilate isomerase
MRKTKVKICGITREEDLAIAVSAGADAIGFVVGAPLSPRNLTLENANKLMKQIPIFVNSVVVTVTNDINLLVKISEKLRPDAIQLHGENLLDVSILRKEIRCARLIKTFHVKTANVINAVVKTLVLFDAVLLDSFTQSRYGGTGVVHDWELSRLVRQEIEPTPIILAGGLTPENVKDAIQIVQPYAVDVSSGVELSPGVKNPKKVREFVNKVKEIDL